MSGAPIDDLSLQEVAALREMLARDEIQRLTRRLARSMDRQDADGIIDCFHPDARDDHGWFIGPREQFARVANDYHRRLFAATSHVLTNHSIDVAGDEAHGEIYVTALMLRNDRRNLNVVMARYIDRYERRDDVWRIADRVTMVEWYGVLQADESRADPSEMFIQGRCDKDDLSYVRPLRVWRPDRF